MRRMLKYLAAKASVDMYHRLMVYSIIKDQFNELRSCPTFKKREELWDECVATYGGEYQKITFVEFGVYEGYSITYFAQKNHNKDSTFIGLDSFEGLPEQWNEHRKGTFNTNGNIPKVYDDRVSFIKGWFQNTHSKLQLNLRNIGHLVVHYDADLYSSTLFALSKMDDIKRMYFAIFDEFTGHETRALYDYIESYNATVSFLAKTIEYGYPAQVLCKITPNIS